MRLRTRREGLRTKAPRQAVRLRLAESQHLAERGPRLAESEVLLTCKNLPGTGLSRNPGRKFPEARRRFELHLPDTRQRCRSIPGNWKSRK